MEHGPAFALYRFQAIETILNWPEPEFSGEKSASLSYPEELIGVFVELGEFDATLGLIEKYNAMYSDFGFVYVLRSKKTENGIAFYCDSRLQSIFEQRSIPEIEGKNICD